MHNKAARLRAGLARVGSGREIDTRIHVDVAHLQSLRHHAGSLSFSPRQPPRSVLSGRHGARLRGRGLNFEELRRYLPGDDVRSIDWKVTARTGEPHRRVFTEERDRPALLVVDQRMAMFFGSRLNMKSVTAAETAALAAFRILDQNDRVGGVVFGDEMIAEIRPERSTRAVDRLLTAIADANRLLRADAPALEPSSLGARLEAVARIARRDHLVMVISDFDGLDQQTEMLLGGLSRHNDVVICLVTDPSAEHVPHDLRLTITDGALQAEIDARQGPARAALAAFASGRIAKVLQWTRRYGVSVLPLSAGEETLPQLRRGLGLAAGRR